MDFMSRHWCDDEVRALLSIWCSPGTQLLLQNTARNKEVYSTISQRLRTMGYKRDWAQCRVKIKNLKYEYRAAKEGTFRGGPSHLARCMRFFNEMDNVLGRRRSQPPSAAAASASMSSDDQYAMLSNCSGMSVLQAALTRDSSNQDRDSLSQGASTSFQLPSIKMEVPDSPPPDIELLDTPGSEDADQCSPAFLGNPCGDSSLGPSASFILTSLNGSMDAGSTALEANAGGPDASQRNLSLPSQASVLDPSTGSMPELQVSQISHPESRGEAATPVASHASPPDLSSVSSSPSRKRNRCTLGPRARRRRTGAKRDNFSKTLEKITGLFLRHERLSEEKYYRWEAQQRQMERLHELRMVSTVIKGLRGIFQPASPTTATKENMEHSSSVQP